MDNVPRMNRATLWVSMRFMYIQRYLNVLFRDTGSCLQAQLKLLEQEKTSLQEGLLQLQTNYTQVGQEHFLLLRRPSVYTDTRGST